MNLLNRLHVALNREKLQLFVSLPENNVKLAAAALAEGADGLKVHINVSHRASGNHFGPLSQYQDPFREIRSLFDGPLGIVPGGSLQEISAVEARLLPETGIDFFSIYAFHMPSFLLRVPGLARTFAIDSEFDTSLIEDCRSFGISALEASIVPGSEYGSPLSFADLLKYRQLVRHSGVPVIVPSQRNITGEDIPALADCGIKVLLIGAIVTGKGEESIRRSVASLRNAMDRL
ncbi:hypothetical protein [Paenibacillus albidus]|uniref:hypothetical protein n=1 Tax=Paenibacillus albidus TaxID=2041023 RepID=UPI001E33D10A|nr:hypothetical protein [Paenibacillus albidus]